MSTIAGEHLGVAIVDDDPIFREIVSANLKQISPFSVFEAGSGDEIVNVIEFNRIDCIILDYDLGMETGLGVKQRIDSLRSERIPIVMLTGDGRESTAIRAFRMGIDDYIPKRGMQYDHLVKTVLDVVKCSRSARSEEAERQRLLLASSIDATTGTEGRTRLDERLTLLTALPSAKCGNYALILVRIADYESIAGRFGFKTADKALRTIAKKLLGLTRSGDVCGRYENGTFLVIANVQGDTEVLNQICSRFSEGLLTRLISDNADIQIAVQVVGAMAVPAGIDVRTPGGQHPALAAAVRGMRQAQASIATVAVASNVSGPSTSDVSPQGSVDQSRGFGEERVRPANDELRSEDKRRHVRHRVLRKGLIHLLDRNSTINCIIRNMSLNGMGLRLDAPCAVPEVFDLEVFGLGPKKRVQVRWQVAKDLGVEIIRSSDIRS